MEERKMILKMVEDGKITAEEGVKLLQALGNEQEGSTTVDSEPTPPKTKEVSTSVNWDYEGNDNSSSQSAYHQSSGTSLFSSFIESAIQKIRDFDLDFNFGSFVEVNHIFQHSNVSLSAVDISVENGSITVVPWNEDDVRIECNAKVYKARDTEEARRILLQEAVFDSEGSTLRFYTKVKSIKLQTTCYLPQQQYERFKLYSFNGTLKGENINAETFESKVVNGRITLADGTFSRLVSETVTGPIEVTNVKASRAEAQTVNGAITLKGQLADVDIETVNGTVTYETSETENVSFAELRATTGSINIILPKGIRIDGKLKTNVGGFTCDLENFEIIEEKKDFVQKSLGFVANKDIQKGIKLHGTTNTGSITVKQ
ncbi:DUF4097 family beta strand repeat-containing protein [Bacillus alkalicellulosilyticus]|uniref:DUF4097 family beta strand repeat-containing protein n=1 Tax=Alkalihalobacterium alkalicellulosilyticum TaxID=1912214 RepID=UPI000998D88F|nr:DUF4097 domain-containing protein [Bacillus alkalicellulosilyticus]